MTKRPDRDGRLRQKHTAILYPDVQRKCCEPVARVAQMEDGKMKKPLKTVAAALSVATLAWASTAAACTVAQHQKCMDAYFYTVNTICPLSFDPVACRQGALLEYAKCKELCSS